MNQELSTFAARLRGLISNRQSAIGNRQFSELALELFALQFEHNAAYRKICESRGLTPGMVEHWTQIPVVPTAAFKELALTCLAPAERSAVFYSSGTTGQKPSRHFHSAESLVVYEASLWPWFESQVLKSADSLSASSEKRGQTVHAPLVILAPPPAQAPHSSLVYMFETIRSRACESAESAFLQTRLQLNADDASTRVFFGKVANDGTWTLDFAAAVDALSPRRQPPGARPLLLLGTAFSFVHLLDYLAENNLRFQLPAGSKVMETGGYKNRSRSLPKTELHRLITERLGVALENIICEYGMSELSSQAYDSVIHPPSSILHPRVFQFPPWTRVQIISPETGREVAGGETGLIRIFDLANVFSVMAIQTEDLGIRRDDGFELIGRKQFSEPRGCSLRMAETRKS